MSPDSPDAVNFSTTRAQCARVDSMRFIVVRISVVARFVVMVSTRNVVPRCVLFLSPSGRVALRVDECRVSLVSRV